MHQRVVTSPSGLHAAGKSFGGTRALDGVSFALRAGEVLALLGENGAGKSTCVKMMAGVHRPDQGSVLIDGQPAVLASPVEAQRRGIAVMHQHPGLFPDLSVAENVFIGHMPRDRAGGVDHAAMRRAAAALLREVGLDCRPDRGLGTLRVPEQQLVEIARALSRDARVLIMDEPTAALSVREVERLFGVVAALRARGVAMLFVGHRMDEIFRIADRIAVLRDGRLVGVAAAADLDRATAVRMMVGRPLADIYPARAPHAGKVALAVTDLARGDAFFGVSFALRAGEVLGLGGLVGSGRSEIARVLFGIDARTAGQVMVAGRDVPLRSPDEAMAAGIAYLSEDRIGQSLVMDFGILTNASLTVLDRITRLGVISRARELAVLEPPLQRLKLRSASLEQPVRTLSGGNQQKVALGKWLAREPRVLILDEPTQGIDVQTKAEVHAIIAELARQGVAVLLISSELPELLGMCDRIVVMREGRMAAVLDANEATQERVMHAATDLQPVHTAAALSAGPDSGRPLAASMLRGLLARREAGLLAAILAVALPGALFNPRLLSGGNISEILSDASLLAIAAAGQLLVLVTRNIDLSVASVIGLAAYASASVERSYPGLGILGGVAAAAAVGLAVGAVNGLIVARARIPAIVVTLGMLSVVRGLTSLGAGGQQISADQVPQSWLDFTGAQVLGVPLVVLIAAAVLLVCAQALRRTAWGREMYAVGSNPSGAALIGLPAAWLVFGAFVLAGLLAGLDGALWASRYATVDARVATGYELTVIAAVVVGEVAIRGGVGTVAGVVLGALALLVIRNALELARVDPLYLEGVYGLVILAAVAVDALVVRGAAGRGARRPT